MKAIDINIATKMWKVNGEEIELIRVNGIKRAADDKLWLEIQGLVVVRWCHAVPYDAKCFEADDGRWVFLDRGHAEAHALKYIEENYRKWEIKFTKAKELIDIQQ